MAGRKDKAGGGKTAPDSNSRDTIRLDKWLFFARFFKTRVLASTVISKGRVRLNGQRQSKPGHAIGQDDVLTFPMGNETRVIRVVALGTHRGPAVEAQALYLDLAPSKSGDLAPNAASFASPLE